MKLLRFGICALVVFAVAAHGGVEDWARAVFETGASLLFLAWSLWIYFTHEERIVFSPLLRPLAAFSLIVCGQWVFHGTASSTESFTGFARCIMEEFHLGLTRTAITSPDSRN